MEFNDLLIFVEVYQCGSFSKAADNLGYVQPNISNRIKKIETELGIRLFERTNKGISLLPAADQLYVHSKKILMDYHNMVEELSKYKTIRVGATPTLAYSVVPQFTQRLKGCGYRNVINSTHSISELFKKLDQNEVDCIWINRDFDNKTYKSMHSFREELFILSNCDWNTKNNFNIVVSKDEDCPYRKKLMSLLKLKKYNVIDFDNLGSVLNSIHTVPNSVTLLPKGLANGVDRSLKITYIKEYVDIDLVAKKETIISLG
ncbi:LysR family transcriptional regulator [Sporolactobacillus pectinivorans]|uniref:LysR family transcriptional regulator n=1 Tax=Sporolactobacillus pectinivorans TaxID=1591408 RepID=UPI000C2575A0|nr:LysR family transcriptional regulator [Sporolactobacillus pectinivorans]